MDQTQTIQCQFGRDMIDSLDMRFEQRRQPTCRDDMGFLAIKFL